ncbi:MAG: type ISP restriction/modification enzyme [Planctomycetaceae bacterium]
MRQCLTQDFTHIYVFHLRGNQRTSGDLSRREGGKIFGTGSRAPIAITIFVKQPEDTRHTILFHDIGDYLSREEKLEKITAFGSVAGIAKAGAWTEVTADSHGDWTKQRDPRFGKLAVLGDKSGQEEFALFLSYSRGVLTSRDAWCFNASCSIVRENMRLMIEFYNAEVARFDAEFPGLTTTKERLPKVANFINTDAKLISWSRALKQDVAKGRTYAFADDAIHRSLYRPYGKQWMYFDRRFNESVLQMPRFFPYSGAENLVITVKGNWSGTGHLALITDCVMCDQTDSGVQCFPRYVYIDADKSREDSNDLFAKSESDRDDGITGAGLKYLQDSYPSQTLTTDDVFYYIYGVLHSEDYRDQFKHNLNKELPRIPAVKKFEDFQAFSQAGRDLAHWHLDYETVDCHPVTLDFTAGDKGPQSLKACKDEHFYVRKMKFPKVKDPETKKSVNDKTTIIYNNYITVRDIPLEAYDYVVNGKSAIEWVMERQAVTTDKASGIVNDANLWATETMNNAAYPLELLLRVITVSLETNRIVSNLPQLDID